MEGEKNLSVLTVCELKRLLASRKFLRSYFYGGKYAANWARRVRETEEELRRRGAL